VARRCLALGDEPRRSSCSGWPRCCRGRG
jgi:hypothetical protein